jgi:uncharacterized protein (TIGR03435 family)
MIKSCGILFFAAAAAFAQTPAAAKLEFEVASVRPAGSLEAMAASGKLHIGMHIDGARVDIGGMSLADLIQIAYKVKRYQVTGPAWIAAQRFDIMAKLPEGASKDQVPEMLQTLLADRFKLTIHRESKDLAVYALIVGKNGPKLKESPPDEPPAPGDDPAASPDAMPKVQVDGTKGAVIKGGPTGTTKVQMGANGLMHFEMEKMQLSALAEFLSRFMERPVVDMTDLKGSYQVAMDLSMEDLRGAARSAGVVIPGGGPAGEPGKAPAEGASDPSGSSIFSNIQQLGLKLDARKAPLEMIVIDHLEKMPTEN